MSRTAILGLTLLLGSTVAVQGQDLWDSSLRLSAGLMSGADKAELGQNKFYGFGIEGAYPLTRNHLVVFEGGYRVLPTTSRRSGALIIDAKTDGYFGGAAYRYRFNRGMLDGLFLQGGLRFSSLRTEQDTIEPGGAADGNDLRTSIKGARATSTKPVVGVGFRFTESLSLEVNLTTLQGQNVQGVPKSGTAIEVALGMHL